MAIPDEVRLKIYNGALARLGSRQLGSRLENREPRRVLDGVWGADDGVVIGALERGDWNFAVRAAQLVYNPSLEPGFGYRRVFEKPSDFVRLSAIASDGYFRHQLTNEHYSEEAGYWLTDYDVIFVKYISSDAAFGFDHAAWSQGFVNYLECVLAWEACERITNAMSKRDRIERDMGNYLKAAKSNDAMGDGVKFFPRGGWASSRSTGRTDQ